MGIIYSFLQQSFPSKPTWSASDIPDLSGKVIIVTGGNTGLGFETAKSLLAHNAKVYIGARSQAKAEEAISKLRELTGKEALFLQLDLGDLKAVKTAADEFLSKEKELHVLFNNGGVMVPPIEQLTADGYDLQFGTNVVGPFYFTKLLLPTLISTAKNSSDGHARILATASSAHLLTTLNFNTFKDGPARKAAGPDTLYAQSKVGNIVVAKEIAKRYGDQGIVSTSLNPGNIKTDMLRHMTGPKKAFLNMISFDVEHGALTQLWGGTSPEGKDLNGKYLIPFAKVGTSSAHAQDPQIGQELWTWLEEQIKNI
ncbi:hypothetical protein PILCRDRAFT_643196 [Piloderma croceum F 1598]|uniref:NAD(P)-binding protein n=1 Tax=Piloderma croceum (strain F 1598) TaxID=765440 RepID=A0A0C3F9T7_PILCF|nr:hypothetical protein PILCRDRAFT_643196 [Piloderma croceum F 1598]